MEPLARVTMLGVLARGAFVFPRARRDGEFAVWNGSGTELPLAEEGRGKTPGDGPGRSRGRELDEERRDGERLMGAGDEVLRGEEYTAVMLLQTMVVLAVLGFLGVRIVGEEDRRHFESWNMLWRYAAPPLLLLLSLSLAGLLMHLVECLTVVVHLWVQSTGALMATLAGIVLVAGGLGTRDLAGHEPGDFVGFLAVLCGAILIWFVSFLGFMQAFWRWTRVPPPSRRRRERGYGTTSGGLAIEDEVWEGLNDG